MKKTNLTMLAAALVAGSAGMWAIVQQPAAEEVRQAVKRHAVEKVIPIGAELPEAGYYTVPFTFGPTQEQYNECLFPPSESGKKFAFDSTEQAFKGEYTPSDVECDYWAFLPAVKLMPGAYKFSVEFKTKNYKEAFSISIGNSQTPEGQTQMLIIKEDYQNPSYVTEATSFTVEEEGLYYIGLHQFSEPNMFNTYIRNFSLDIIDDSKPRTPEITTVDMAGGEGTITVQVPTTDFNDSPLPDVLSLHIGVDGEEYADSPYAVEPGENKVIPMTVPIGNHVFTAMVSAEIDGTVKNSEIFELPVRVTRIIEVPAPIPAHFSCDEDEYSLCTIINANEDTSYWKYNDNANNEGPGFQMSYSSTLAGDDFIVFPALDCAEAGTYEVSFQASTKYDEECLEVYFVEDPTLEALRETAPAYSLDNFKTSAVYETYKFKASVTEPGLRYLVFRYCSPRYKSYVFLRDVNVVLGDPRQIGQPQFGTISFDGTEGTVEVVLPSTTAAGDPLGDAAITAYMKVDGEDYGQPLTGTPGETLSVPMSLAIGNHTVSCTAAYTVDGQTFTSDPISTSFKVMRPASFAYELPLELPMTGLEFSDDIIVFDLNEDGKTWSATADGLKYYYSQANPGDDWVILLPVNVESVEQPLEISVEAKSSTSYPEEFSVWLGNQPSVEAMLTEVLGPTTVQTNDWTVYGNTVAVPAPGKYYIGFHCTSPADKLALYLRNLRVAYGIDRSLYPQTVSGLSAVADPTGLLQATVSFTMPVETMDGTAITDASLNAVVSCGENHAEVSGAPGEEVSTVIETAEGANTVSVTVANENGISEPLEVEVRCGLDTPVRPRFTSATVTESGLGVILTWDAVTEGVNGGVIDPAKLQYRITPWDDEDQDWAYWESIYTTDTNCVFEVAPGTAQDYVTIGIEAFQSASTNSSVYQMEVVVGQPYEADITETFADGRFNYGPVYFFSNSTGYDQPTWFLSTPEYYLPETAADPEQYMLIGQTYSPGSDSGVMLPMVTTENLEHATLTFDVYIHEGNPYLAGMAGTYGEDRVILGDFPTAGEAAQWQEVSFEIPQNFLGRQWVQPGVYARFDGGSQNRVFIKGWSFKGVTESGVERVSASGVNVSGVRGALLIAGAQGMKVTVSDLSGKVVYAAVASANGITVPAAAGVYAVSVGNSVFKAIVK